MARRKDIFVQIEKDIKRIEKKSQEIAEELAKMFYDKLIENIETNYFGFKISDITARLREAYGNSSKMPLVDSGEYLSSILVDKTKVMVQKGVHKGGLTFEELSWILEFGRRDKGSPPFPVWRLTYGQIKEDMFKLVNERLNELKK